MGQGCPWRDMHERYGLWSSVYVRFRRWAEQCGWDRNRIARMFSHLKQCRCVATRYDKTALLFAIFVNLVARCKWLPNFVNEI
ncbi:transposase [Sphingomonas sp. BK345]|uniref:transposase n=1 Tax=Sphingomonas sp. BK345 TaxID=2586980 RepID=UPI003906C039